MDETEYVAPLPNRKTNRQDNRKRKLQAFLELMQKKQEERVGTYIPNTPKKMKSAKPLGIRTSGLDNKIKKKKPKSPRKKKNLLHSTKKRKVKSKAKKRKALGLLTDGLDNKKVMTAVAKAKKRKALGLLTDGLDNKKVMTAVANEDEKPKSPTLDKTIISECNYLELKHLKRQITKLKLPWPLIELTPIGFESQVTSEDKQRKPLTMKDVQASLLHLLMPGRFPFPSRWSKIVRAKMISHIVTVVIEGVSLKDLHAIKSTNNDCENQIILNGEVSHSENTLSDNKNKNNLDENSKNVSVSVPQQLSYALPRTTSVMPIQLELLANYSSKPWQDLLYTTKSNIPWNIELNECESQESEEGIKQCDQASTSVVLESSSDKDSSIIDIENGIEDKIDIIHPSDRFDRRQLLLNPVDLYTFKYPVPSTPGSQEVGYVLSLEKYTEVKSTSPMFGIDCEMCLTCANQFELASISVVNEQLKLIYHRLVKPDNKIINYMTRYSGLTEDMFRTVTTTLRDIHRDFRQMLPPDAIIVGHSLNSDLKAMKMMHPYVIDTAIAYNLSYIRQKPSSLQLLTKKFLGREIQMNPGGHDPTEDAVASLELIQLKLKNDVAFGNVMQGYKSKPINRDKQGSEHLALPVNKPEVNGSSSPEDYFNLFQHMTTNKVKSAILMTPSSAKSCEDILRSVPQHKIDVHILAGNKQISKKAAEISISKDFTYLHMKMDSLRTCKSMKRRKHQLKKLDKRLQRIFDGACQKSLLMYIFTGLSVNVSSQKCSNGLVMCCIKGLEEISSSLDQH